MLANHGFMEGELVLVDIAHGKFSKKTKKLKCKLTEENIVILIKIIDKIRNTVYLVELNTLPRIYPRFKDKSFLRGREWTKVRGCLWNMPIP